MNSLEQPLFNNRDRELMAEVAIRLLPNLERVAERWAEAIKLDAPADKLPGMRHTLRGMTIPFLSGFFERLSEGNPDAALAHFQSFIESTIRSQLDEPERQRATIEALFSRRARCAICWGRSWAGYLEGDDGQVAAILPFNRLWSQAIETTGLIYARLREGHLRQLYDDARGTAEKLRQSEERLRLLVEEAKDYAIWMMDTAGCVASWNRGGEQLMGYSADEIMGRHVSCFFPPQERAEGRPQQNIEKARVQDRFETEGWRLRKDGSRFFCPRCDYAAARCNRPAARLLDNFPGHDRRQAARARADPGARRGAGGFAAEVGLRGQRDPRDPHPAQHHPGLRGPDGRAADGAGR